MPDSGDIGATLLEPLGQLTDLLSKAINATGEGVEWTAEQIETLALLVAVLAAKVEELQAHLRADDAEPEATA